MRKLIFVILLVFVLSCEKEDTYCWECRTVSNCIVGNFKTPDVIEISEVCDYTDREIRLYEDAKTLEIVIDYPTVSTRLITTCKRK